MKRGSNRARTLGIVAIALFGAAMLFPALGTCTPASTGTVAWLPNRQVLLEGPLGPFFFEFGWYANVPFGIALVSLARARRVARWVSVTQAALVLSSPAPVTLIGASEAPATICRWGVGYWMWGAAQLLVLASSFISRSAASR